MESSIQLEVSASGLQTACCAWRSPRPLTSSTQPVRPAPCLLAGTGTGTLGPVLSSLSSLSPLRHCCFGCPICRRLRSPQHVPAEAQWCICVRAGQRRIRQVWKRGWRRPRAVAPPKGVRGGMGGGLIGRQRGPRLGGVPCCKMAIAGVHSVLPRCQLAVSAKLSDVAPAGTLFLYHPHPQTLTHISSPPHILNHPPSAVVQQAAACPGAGPALPRADGRARRCTAGGSGPAGRAGAGPPHHRSSGAAGAHQVCLLLASAG